MLSLCVSEARSWLEFVCLSADTDEELGGLDGMKLFVETDDFRRLNVGFALDEGGVTFSLTT